MTRGITQRRFQAWSLLKVMVIAAPETDETVLPQMLQEAGPPQDSSQRLSHALSTFERAAAQVRTLKPLLGGLPGKRKIYCIYCVVHKRLQDTLC